MGTGKKLISAVFLVCALALALGACGAAAGHPSAAPSGAVQPSLSLNRGPEASKAPSDIDNFAPAANDAAPSITGDIPAMQPDEETQLTYTVDGEELTVAALRHHTLSGYSIVYDTEHYVCNAFTEGDSYWASEGNYLSITVIFGMPVEDVLAGLRLQENIAMEPESAVMGGADYPVQTLYTTTAAGLYRQFWALDWAGDVLLVEQSFDTVSDDAELYRASQLAMLDTLTLFY